MTKSNTRLVPCDKCNGTGRITWSSLANGLCFRCWGRKVFRQPPPDMVAAFGSRAAHDLNALAESIADDRGNMDWRAHIAARAARDLMNMCDTEAARAVLQQVVTWGRSGCMEFDDAAARAACDLVIAAGRELRASESEAA